MNWKLYSGLILVIILIFIIIFYPLQFDFYQYLKAKRISDFIFIPSFGLIVIYDLYQNINKGEKNWKKYIIDFLKFTGVFSIAYFLILRSFFASLIIFFNTILGEVDTVEISGIIVEKTDRLGSGKYLGKYELIVDQNGKEYVFDSNHNTIKNYIVGEEFSEKMRIGIFNIIYK